VVNRTDRKAAIVGRQDKFANGVKPKEFRQALEANGYCVDLVDSTGLGRRGTAGFLRMLPALGLNESSLYIIEATREALKILAEVTRLAQIKKLDGLLVELTIGIRGRLLNRKFSPKTYDLIVCESGMDEAMFAFGRIADTQILDLPSPFVDELYYGGHMTPKTHLKLRRRESQHYAAADLLSFHWHTYQSFVQSTFYDGTNLVGCGYGVRPKALRAHFSDVPRIVFLGGLDGYWINRELLEAVCESYGCIDIWGGPPPRGVLSKYYKGYAPSLDVLASYQAGLVTITDDPLRRASFSSKQLEYASYGLPTLVPEWRNDEVLAGFTVPYNQCNFVERVSALRNEVYWNELSNKALETAASLPWSLAFQECLERIELRQRE
jgi:hypothetical protein